MIHHDIIVIGAGPAGLAAAVTTAGHGLRILLVDERAQINGPVYRPPLEGWVPKGVTNHKIANGRCNMLLERFHRHKDRIDFLSNAFAWGIFPPKRIAVSCENRSFMLDAPRVLLACGACEYVPPFPGWTLPGVMTPGEALRLSNTFGAAQGRRVLLVGAGPLLQVVALELHRGGMEVVGIVEATRPRDYAKALVPMIAAPDQLKLAWRSYKEVRRAGIPVETGHVIVEAHGHEKLREVVIAPCDRQWMPDRARSKSIKVDILGVGYGFIPHTQLAQLLGCEMIHSRYRGGWIPKVDETLTTTVKGVWAVCEHGGVTGETPAELEGSLAGMSIAHDAGAMDKTEFQLAVAPIAGRLKALRRYRNGLDRVCAAKPGLVSLATPETIACRCVGLTIREVDDAIGHGVRDSPTLRSTTRLGTCQGNMCWSAIAQRIANATGRTLADVGPFSAVTPLRPVVLEEIASGIEPANDLTESTHEVQP